MHIDKFKIWADGHRAINPIVKDEVEFTLEEPSKREKTGRKIYVFVFPSGRAVRIYCDEEDTIVDVEGAEETPWM